MNRADAPRPLLTVTELACRRGGRLLFSGVSFELSPGEWLLIQGRNGVGKSTLLRTLAGLSPAEAGDIRWQDRESSSAGSRGLAYGGAAPAFKDELTASENLHFAAALEGQPVETPAISRALGRAGLCPRGDLPVRHFSTGQRRRLHLAQLNLWPCSTWMLDEPANGLDVDGVATLGHCLEEHLSRGGIALVASHLPLPVNPCKVLAL